MCLEIKQNTNTTKKRGECRTFVIGVWTPTDGAAALGVAGGTSTLSAEIFGAGVTALYMAMGGALGVVGATTGVGAAFMVGATGVVGAIMGAAAIRFCVMGVVGATTGVGASFGVGAAAAFFGVATRGRWCCSRESENLTGALVAMLYKQNKIYFFGQI
jgi:hypothetical protein